MNLLKNLIIFFKFTDLNKKIIKLRNNSKPKKIILVEFNHLCVQHICFAHLINSILKNKNYFIYSYTGYSLLSFGLKYPFLKNFFFY